jgi:uncharacterized SAM-binding protein YcdF (DUF218 family)
MRLKFLNLKVAPLVMTAGLVILSSTISIKLAITQSRFPKPQAILVLGGNQDRIRFTAELAKLYPTLDIWVSDLPSEFNLNQQTLQQANIPKEQVHYDFCATDTVTNFTCMTQPLIKQNVYHVYLVTSDYHMARSKVIASLVFGSRGITVTPVSVPSNGYLKESKIRIIRDYIRSLIWILTGRTGASFNPDLEAKEAKK